MILIFDLDDTLYPEIEYARSALRFAGAQIDEHLGRSGTGPELLALFERGERDAIGAVASTLGLADSVLAQTVSAMRAHSPDIRLRPGADVVMRSLRLAGHRFGIVTDGRSVTQRAKLAALDCLDASFISISEEVGLSKAEPLRFQQASAALGSAPFCYVADNPAKDFLVPNQLGWDTVMLTGLSDAIHDQGLPQDHAYHPKHQILDLSELKLLYPAIFGER